MKGITFFAFHFVSISYESSYEDLFHFHISFLPMWLINFMENLIYQLLFFPTK